MKRLKALAISLILSIFISSSILIFYSKNIEKNTILLMESSELVATLENEEHPKQLLNYSDKNIMQIGGGHYQSLLQAIILGSIGNNIPVKKVNLIISMQWFEKKV